MLDEGKELGKKIRAAIKAANLEIPDVADHFKITRQAVNSWFKTGRIGKNRLLGVMELVRKHGVQPDFWGDSIEDIAGKAVPFPSRSERRPKWPFSANEEAVCRLPDKVLEGIDSQLVYHLSQHHQTGPEPRARRRSSG